jgi:hypothetical protein
MEVRTSGHLTTPGTVTPFLEVWHSTGTSVLRLQSPPGSVPVGTGFKATYVQRSDGTDGGRWLYINGVQVAALAGASDVKTFDQPPAGTWYVGTWPTGAAALDGAIAEVASWNRALSAAEVLSLARPASMVQLADWAVTVDESTSGNWSPAPYASPASGWTVEVVSDAGIVNLTASGALINYAIGSTTGDATLSPTVRLNRTGGLQSRTATISVTVLDTSVTPPPPGGFACVTSGAGTLVNLGTADNKEATTQLTAGGNARYNASGIIARTRWLGTRGCDPGLHTTTNQFLFRAGTNHNGGCISGGAIYGNLTQHENYDNVTVSGVTFKLYPCSDGGQVFIGRGVDMLNFTVEGFRFHGCWDSIRLAQINDDVVRNVTVKGCWFTCIRDDVIENDAYSDGQVFTDNLIGDVIGTGREASTQGPTNAGCDRFYSMFGGTSIQTSKRVTISNNLVWSSQMRMTQRANGINGYCVGPIWKLRTDTCPRMNITGNTFLVDARAFGSGTPVGGDPMWDLNRNGAEAINSSSGNVIIWRDLNNLGSYPWPVPPGFRVEPWSTGQALWNNKVNAWKTAHPHVRRFNKTGIAKPFGGTFNLVDVG